MRTFWNISFWVFLLAGCVATLTGHDDALTFTEICLACLALQKIEELKK